MYIVNENKTTESIQVLCNKMSGRQKDQFFSALSTHVGLAGPSNAGGNT